MTLGLLAVLSEPGAVPVAEFHSWYDEEHVPLRVRLDGIHTARRLQAVDRQCPSWLALYDLDLEVLERADYRVLREQRSVREQHVVDRLQTLDRRIYELCGDWGRELPEPALVVMTSFQLPEGSEGELADWYAEEHVPLLHAIPGWNRTRRYRLRDGAAPRWLALHELSDPAAVDTPAYRHATSTSWRDRVMGSVTGRERRVWRLYRNFTQA